jgi:hypothetical protein
MDQQWIYNADCYSKKFIDFMATFFYPGNVNLILKTWHSHIVKTSLAWYNVFRPYQFGNLVILDQISFHILALFANRHT